MHYYWEITITINFMSKQLSDKMQQYEGSTEDQLLQVALQDSSLQEEALQFMESEQHVLKFIQQNSYYRGKVALVRKIISPHVIKQVVTDTKAPEAQISAIMRISDDAFLLQIALSDKYTFDVRFEAIEAVHGKKVLQKLALELDDKTLRKIAVKKIRDDAVFEQIIQHDSDRKIREIAISRLQVPNEELLMLVALSDPNYYVKEAAVDRIFSPKLLKNIALQCTVVDIQRLAIYKLDSVDDLLELRLIVPTPLQQEIQKKITKLRS